MTIGPWICVDQRGAGKPRYLPVQFMGTQLDVLNGRYNGRNFDASFLASTANHHANEKCLIDA